MRDELTALAEEYRALATRHYATGNRRHEDWKSLTAAARDAEDRQGAVAAYYNRNDARIASIESSYERQIGAVYLKACQQINRILAADQEGDNRDAATRGAPRFPV